MGLSGLLRKSLKHTNGVVQLALCRQTEPHRWGVEALLKRLTSSYFFAFF